MTRLRIGLLALLLVVAGATYAQDEVGPPPAGTWKVTLPTLAEDTGGFPIVLLKFDKGKKEDKKDNKEGWTATVIAAAPKFASLSKAEISKISVSDKTWTFTIKSTRQTLNCEVNLGKDAKAKTFYGEMRAGRDVIPLEIERTKMTGLEQFDNLREMIESEPLGMRAAQMARILMSDAEEKKIKLAEVRGWADKAVKSAALYGPSVVRQEQLLVARTLAEQSGYETIALQYANRAEAGLDDKTDSPTVKRVLDVLMLVQEKAGKKEDAAKTLLRIKKLTFPIKVAKFAGRQAKSDRVVLAELFTACNEKTKSCAPSDAAIEALLKTYKPSELAVLVYQQHLPETIGNPLSSPDSEERLGFYGRAVPSLPVLILNGRYGVRGGGGPEDSQETYESYTEQINTLLEAESKAELKLSAARKDGKIEIATEVSKLEDPDETLRLRVVLVETETAYKGGNGTATHYHVVRAMPSGADGTALTKASVKKTYSVDEKELRKTLEAYQEKINKKKPFPTKEKPLDLKNFKVIAFVQNDRNQEVLQAAQVDVK